MAAATGLTQALADARPIVALARGSADTARASVRNGTGDALQPLELAIGATRTASQKLWDALDGMAPDAAGFDAVSTVLGHTQSARAKLDDAADLVGVASSDGLDPFSAGFASSRLHGASSSLQEALDGLANLGADAPWRQVNSDGAIDSARANVIGPEYYLG